MYETKTKRLLGSMSVIQVSVCKSNRVLSSLCVSQFFPISMSGTTEDPDFLSFFGVPSVDDVYFLYFS